MARAVGAAGLAVIEAEQPTRTTRRGRGKSDPIDAHLAVTFALQLQVDRLPTPAPTATATPCAILLGARHDLTLISTAQVNRLRALLRDGDSTGDSTGDGGDADGQLARGALTTATLTTLARRRLPLHATRAQAVRHDEIRRLALAVRDARRALAANQAQLQAIVDELAPGLTDRRGIGPIVAAQALVSFSHPGRIRGEAAFAALAGASPLEASSGRTVRHRLNRGGDRALNRALHTIAMTRMASCPRTRAYVVRRRAEGKTPREIRRCLKRYIARELYRTLTTTMINN